MNKDIIQDTMSDDDIRILGGGYQQNKNTNKTPKRKFSSDVDKKKLLIAALFILIFIILGIFAYLIFSKPEKTSLKQGIDAIDSTNVYSEKSVVNTMKQKSVLHIQDTTVNDIPLQIFAPKGCQISLHMGPMLKEENIMLQVQAADIRSDKDLPVGAFVYNGELIAKGHSKYGFCAIIGEDVTLGRQLETTLFERAVEENGSFFRQYSLVSSGQLISIPPKGKSLRKALCLRNGELQVIITKDKESYHDFSQALVDLGIEEAISLVGGTSHMMYKNEKGEIVRLVDKSNKYFQSENYLIWKAKK